MKGFRSLMSFDGVARGSPEEVVLVVVECDALSSFELISSVAVSVLAC